MPRVVRRNRDPDDDGEAAPLEAERATPPPAPAPQRKTVTGRTFERARGPPKLEPAQWWHRLRLDELGVPGWPRRRVLKEVETASADTVEV